MSTVSLMTSLLTEDCSRFLPPQHRTLDHRLFVYLILFHICGSHMLKDQLLALLLTNACCVRICCAFCSVLLSLCWGNTTDRITFAFLLQRTRLLIVSFISPWWSFHVPLPEITFDILTIVNILLFGLATSATTVVRLQCCCEAESVVWERWTLCSDNQWNTVDLEATPSRRTSLGVPSDVAHEIGLFLKGYFLL